MTEPQVNPRAQTPAQDGVNIPLGWVRWLFYTVILGNLLIPFELTPWQIICGAAILGHFSSQLNAIVNKNP